MKNKDLLRVCAQNLFRHKTRTMLTALGVVLGCCSVIIMISIGIGMKESQEKALAQMGDLTIINVHKAGKSKAAAKLNKTAIHAIREVEGVEAATPKLTAEQVPVTIYAGRNRRYRSTYITLVGLEAEAAGRMGYQLTDGSWPGSLANHVLVGKNFAYAFEDTKRPAGKNVVDMWGNFDGTGTPDVPPPYFDSMKTPLYMELESGKEDEKKLSYELTVDGRMKEDYSKGEETSMGIVLRLEDLQKILEEQQKLSGKKAEKNSGYEHAIVKVKTIQDVSRVEQQIKQMGFRTSSMESIRKPMEQEARQKQMMLGGLGAISLFVAALGITNTMIMSISERTREIGVMKSLGCFIQDIRKIFLLEAGGIGLIGGVAGMLISYLISAGMNFAANAGMSMGGPGMMDAPMMMPEDLAEEASRISVIPWWLALSAILFSILIGVGAGYYPANKAVKIPALEAIKHD